MNVKHFGEDFKWGISTAAYQTEGAYNIDGKGASIWDTFTNKSGKIYKNQNANIACDFYHRYKQDIDILKALKIPNFRFSISWSRVLPEGLCKPFGMPNQKGIDFYNRVIDYCLEQGIEPWITLYHWDLPQNLYEMGGWKNREIVHWFAEYAEFCAKLYSDRVKYWMVLNEPLVFTGGGYFLGWHAPGKRGLSNFLPAAHHASLCQAEGARAVRAVNSDVEIGTTFSCSHIEPYRQTIADAKAAKRADAVANRLFFEPILGLGYPFKDLGFLSKIEKYMYPNDERLMSFPFDFIGIQNYTREKIRFSWMIPYLRANIVTAKKRKVPYTLMDWEVYPPSIYEMLKKFGNYPDCPKIYITENGAAFEDLPFNGHVADRQRKEYIQQNIAQVMRAKKEGIDVQGYFIWTFTDNFEWAEGYRPRFGLVYVDFDTQERIIKESGHWYSDFIQGKDMENPDLRQWERQRIWR